MAALPVRIGVVWLWTRRNRVPALRLDPHNMAPKQLTHTLTLVRGHHRNPGLVSPHRIKLRLA